MEVQIDPRKRGFGRTVLVVDDNQAIRKMLATAFTSDGFKTCEAENGTEAVELAQKIKPDVITMDLAMPGISGLVASSALRKLFPRVPRRCIRQNWFGLLCGKVVQFQRSMHLR